MSTTTVRLRLHAAVEIVKRALTREEHRRVHANAVANARRAAEAERRALSLVPRR